MSYTVLARKYRPQSFEDLVGQSHVARTLANAIRTERVAHAFLFTGVRGVGKTTSARLLAKALNCEKGPTPTPCNECDQCKEITAGVDLDVLEMDGASNNSVDDVRRLQESIPYRPARDRLKIIIVDEVHMLSQGAFNAFLKTLEEPPAHVKFIFATTESHKVPITIRSRCQRYDFRLIPQAVISDRVRSILDSEGVKADDEAVAIVAREAAGSMRDALTLLDQLVAFAGDELHGAEVAATLGIAARHLVHQTARSVLKGDGAAVLTAAHELISHGLDPLHFAKQLLEYMRDLVVLSVAGDDAGALAPLVQEERQLAVELGQSVDSLELQRAFTSLSSLVDDVARASMPRTVLEMGLVGLATRPPLRQVGELLARLSRLEQGGAGGAAPREGGSGGRPRQSAKPAREAHPDSPGSRPASALAQEPPAEPTRAPGRAPIVEEVPPSAEGDDALLSVWERVVSRVREAKPALGAILEHGVPLQIDRELTTVAFPEGSFFGKQAASPESREGLADALASVVGGRPEVKIQFTADSDGSGRTVAQVRDARRDERAEETRRQALGHPTVLEAMQVFPEGAGSVKVRIDE